MTEQEALTVLNIVPNFSIFLWNQYLSCRHCKPQFINYFIHSWQLLRRVALTVISAFDIQIIKMEKRATFLRIQAERSQK
jgi:hypothetical protein